MVNPVRVFGPVLGPDISTSIFLVQRLLERSVPGLPRLSIGLVDVRDVADLHLRAMVDPKAKGERFLAVAGKAMAAIDVARVLKAHLCAAADPVPYRQLPDWAVRLVGLVDPAVRQIVPELGNANEASNAKARRVLGAALQRGGDPGDGGESDRARSGRRRDEEGGVALSDSLPPSSPFEEEGSPRGRPEPLPAASNGAISRSGRRFA